MASGLLNPDELRLPMKPIQMDSLELVHQLPNPIERKRYLSWDIHPPMQITPSSGKRAEAILSLDSKTILTWLG